MKMYRLLMMLICLGIGWLGEQQAQASGVAWDADMRAAVASAPNGMTMAALFEVAGVDFSATQLVDGAVTKQSIAQITNDNIQPRSEQVGAFWSQKLGKTSAKVDLTHDTRWSFWLYFGHKTTNLSSGMAFVLQNDDGGTHAIANGGKGQSLGVWAGDRNGFLSANFLAQSAIQNSWALEFDTTVNNAPRVGAGSFYDHEGIASRGPHIASAYPGQAATYKQYGSRNKYYYALNHQQAKAMSHPADGKWRHVTIDWHAQKSQLTYAFNDRHLETRQPVPPEVQDTVTVDLKKLSPDGQTAAESATWGITGSTGKSNSANQLIVLDETPRQLHFKTSAQTMVMKEAAVQRTLTAGDTVTAGTQLRDVMRATDLRATTGGTLTQGMAYLPMGSVIKRLNGQFFADGQTPLYSLHGNDLLAERVDFASEQPVFTQKAPSLQFMLNGEAQAMARDTYVPPRKVIFAGPDHYVEMASVGYTVQRKLNLKLENLGASEVSLEKDEDLTVTARLSNQGQPLDADAMKDNRLKIRVNDRTFSLEQLKGSWQGMTGRFQFVISNAQLKAGTNQISIAARNRQDEAQPLKIVATQHSGELAFESMPCYCAFQGRLTGKQQLISRDKDWQLCVRDSRGRGNSWQLQLCVSQPFTTSKGRELRGNVVYRKQSSTQTVGTAPIVIEQRSTKTDDERTDVASSWAADTGLLVLADGDATAGDYQGELRWQLTDAP